MYFFCMFCINAFFCIFQVLIAFFKNMASFKKSKTSKLTKYVRKYPDEFISTSTNELWCVVCNKTISFDRKSTVIAHINCKQHLEHFNSLQNDNTYTIKLPEFKFPENFVKMFLEIDIPLYKLREKPLQQFLCDFKLPKISHSTAHRMVQNIANNKIKKIKELMFNQKIFLIVDESSKCDLKYTNILIGTLSNPTQSYLIRTFTTNDSINADIITRYIDDCIHLLNIQRESFLLLISDAATYMIKAAKNLKIFYKMLTHITCLSHLLHNSVLRLRSFYPDIDNLISSTKAATVKNASRAQNFAAIGKPPTPVLTRWGTWLEAAEYYHNNFRQVHDIISSFSDDGLLVSRNKESINKEGLERKLEELMSCYGVLIKMIREFENKEYHVKSGVEAIINLNFNGDPKEIKKYLLQRLDKNEILKIVEKRELVAGLDSNDMDLLNKAQCTSVDVERSFSILKKLLRSDRNFGFGNINEYMICYYNKNI